MVRAPLGLFLKIKHGFAFPGEEFGDDPSYPTLVTPGNFAIGGGFKDGKPKTFLGDYPAEYELAPGDLIVTMTDLSKAGDTLGLPAIVPDDRTYLHNQRIGLVEITDPERADARFLNYYLRNDSYRAFVLGSATGSTVRHTSPSRIAAFVADLPALSQQRAIAEVLGALDEKLAANARTVTVVSALAGAMFESMILDAETIPLSATADFINGRAFTKGATGTGRVVIRIAELNSGIGGSTVRTELDVPDQHLARPGDLLFAWSGSLTVHRWFRGEGIINQHIFKVVPKASYPQWLVHALLDEALAEFKAIAADKATTMGHIQRHHLDVPVAIPPTHLIAENDAMMSNLYATALAAQRENLALTEIRDALLPELMSGRLRVRDVEQHVAAVV